MATVFAFLSTPAYSMRALRAPLCRASSTVLRGGSTAMSNPLLDMSSLPKFDKITAPDVKPAVESVLSTLDEEFVAFESKLTATDNPTCTLQP